MKHVLLVLIAFAGLNAHSQNLDSNTIWHCPGVFDAIDASQCPAPQAERRADVAAPSSQASGANDYLNRITSCQASSVILKLKENVLLTNGYYDIEYNRYSKEHLVKFKLESAADYSISKEDLIKKLDQLAELGQSNQVVYVDCNATADISELPQ